MGFFKPSVIRGGGERGGGGEHRYEALCILHNGYKKIVTTSSLYVGLTIETPESGTTSLFA